MANDHEIEFHKIESCLFRRSKLGLFLRSKVLMFFDNFVQEVNTSIMRSTVANNAFLTFDLMIKVASTKMFMRLKV